MKKFSNKAAGFDEPTQLPRDDEQRGQWQSANKAWWESTPMRYDWREKLAEIPGSKEYFNEIDRRFLTSVRKYMPWKAVPFEELIPFDELRDKDVLEIGVGHGTHAQLISPRCKSFTMTALIGCFSALRYLRSTDPRTPSENFSWPSSRQGPTKADRG